MSSHVVIQPGQTGTFKPTPGLHIKGTGTIQRAPQRERLGDKLTRYLKICGITEERYKQLKSIAGFSPNCGCPARRYFLNHISKRMVIGYAKGGVQGAWQAALNLAEEVKQKFPQEEKEKQNG